MNWDAAGAIAEIVGATAVLVTLVYLTYQVRQTAAAVRSSSTADHHNMMVNLRLSLAQNAELNDIFNRGLDDRASLTRNELSRFDQTMSVVLHASEQAFEFNRLGIANVSLWNSQRASIEWMVENPGFRDYWKQWGPHRDGDFRIEIQALIDKATDA
jgi:hypothetical protein